jgi:hypothetical protein
MVFTKQNIKVTLALIILIIALLWCNIKKLYKSMIKTQITNIPNKKIEDHFYNTPEKNETNSKFNEIVYGMNPNCLKDKQSPDADKLCPGSHPNIPCSRIGCPSDENKNKLTDDMKRDIYLYTYLTGLLESADIWEKDTDDYWYTTNWRAEVSS